MQAWGRQREVEKIKSYEGEPSEPGEERLTPTPGAATTLYWYPADGVIWLNTEIGARDGLCIAIGATKRAAIEDAIKELEDRLRDLHAARGAMSDGTSTQA